MAVKKKKKKKNDHPQPPKRSGRQCKHCGRYASEPHKPWCWYADDEDDG